MEGIVLTPYVQKGITAGNFPRIVKEERKNFLAASQSFNKFESATNALKDQPAANRVVVGILKSNEPSINNALDKIGQPKTGDIVQKSVRLYNATDGRKGVAAVTLVSLLSNPAVITAIISLVGFLVAAFGKKAVTEGEVTEGETVANPVDGTNYLKMAKDLLEGKTGAQFDSGIKNAGLLIGGVMVVFVVLIIWLATKKK